MGKTFKKEKRPKFKLLKEKSHKIKNFKNYVDEILEEEEVLNPLSKKK